MLQGVGATNEQGLEPSSSQGRSRAAWRCFVVVGNSCTVPRLLLPLLPAPAQKQRLAIDNVLGACGRAQPPVLGRARCVAPQCREGVTNSA